MGGGILFQLMVGDQVDLRDRRCAVVDPTGELWPVLVAEAEQRNRDVIWETPRRRGAPGATGERSRAEAAAPALPARALRAGPGRARRRGPLGARRGRRAAGLRAARPGDPGGAPAALAARLPHRRADLHRAARTGSRSVVNEEVRRRRCAAAELEPRLVEQLSKPRAALHLGPGAPARATAASSRPSAENEVRTFGVPLGGPDAALPAGHDRRAAADEPGAGGEAAAHLGAPGLGRHALPADARQAPRRRGHGRDAGRRLPRRPRPGPSTTGR